MDSPLGPIRLIVNPSAGRGAGARAVGVVRDLLDQEGLSFGVTETAGPGDGIVAAREAVGAGCGLIVAVGGDGTVHEVVNGMMGSDGPLNPEAALGIVPAGSGCDTVRTFGLPQDPAAAAAHLLGSTVWGKLDVGRLRYRTFDGADATRWFINIGEAGIGAQVVVAAARMPAWLAGRAYRVAALRGIMTFKPQHATVKMNGRKARLKVGTPLGSVSHEGRVTMIVFANCQFFGGGLRVAPRAIPSDGMLDVLVGEGSKWDAVRALQRMPNGLHVPSRTIAEYLADSIEIEAAQPLAIEADGEPLGTTPVSVDVVAGAIPLKI